jgi:hypothetical protein
MEPLRARRPAPIRPASGELAKALLIDTTTRASYPVMYNPEELKLEQGNVVAEVAIPGLEAPPLQYVRGRSRVLTLELFFDTFESGDDVRVHTAPIVGLLDKQPQTQAPPVLLFSFGRVQLRCVLVDAGQRFTMFLRDGTPVRSTLSVRLQEYADVEVEIRRGFFVGSPTAAAVVGAGTAATARAVAASAAALGGSETLHTVLRGDTLSGIAAAYLGDAGRWREIADANRIEDPLSLRPGTPLIIPGPAAPPGGARRR